MPTTRLSFTCEDPGVTFNGTSAYRVPSLPAPGADGWSSITLSTGSTVGRIDRSSMSFCGDAGYFIRELQVFQLSEANFAIGLRPPQGLTYAGGFINLEVLVGSFGSTNQNFPDNPQALEQPVYVPPGWEIVIRCSDATMGSGTTVPFIGSFGFVFDTIRNFDEAIQGFLSMDVPRAAVLDWNV